MTDLSRGLHYTMHVLILHDHYDSTTSYILLSRLFVERHARQCLPMVSACMRARQSSIPTPKQPCLGLLKFLLLSILLRSSLSGLRISLPPLFFFFFFNNPAPPEISPLPLHDPLPI